MMKRRLQQCLGRGRPAGTLTLEARNSSSSRDNRTMQKERGRQVMKEGYLRVEGEQAHEIGREDKKAL